MHGTINDQRSTTNKNIGFMTDQNTDAGLNAFLTNLGLLMRLQPAVSWWLAWFSLKPLSISWDNSIYWPGWFSDLNTFRIGESPSTTRTTYSEKNRFSIAKVSLAQEIFLSFFTSKLAVYVLLSDNVLALIQHWSTQACSTAAWSLCNCRFRLLLLVWLHHLVAIYCTALL